MAGKTRKKGGRTAFYRTADPFTGDGGGTGGGGGGTGATPPAQPGGGAGAPGTGTGGGDGSPAPGAGSIPLDVLPEQLRGKPASEIKFTLDTLVKSVTAANSRNKALEDELRQLKTKPAAPPPPPRDDKPKKPLADRLLEDPEDALEEFFRGRAAPYEERIAELNKRLGETEVDFVRRSVPDFDEYAEDVFKNLDEVGAPRTKENIMGAYTMAVGLRTLQEKELARRKAEGGSEAPAPDPTKGTEKKYNKTPLSEEIRVGLGMSEEEYYEKHADPNAFSIKVPT